MIFIVFYEIFGLQVFYDADKLTKRNFPGKIFPCVRYRNDHSLRLKLNKDFNYH